MNNFGVAKSNSLTLTCLEGGVGQGVGICQEILLQNTKKIKKMLFSKFLSPVQSGGITWFLFVSLLVLFVEDTLVLSWRSKHILEPLALAVKVHALQWL